MHGPVWKTTLAGLMLLVLGACGLLSSAGPAPLEQPELCCDGGMTAPPGVEADFDMTLSNPGGDPAQAHVVMTGQTPSDWRIALCYEELCVAGRGEVEMDFDLAAGEALDIQAKFFVPEDAQPGEQATAAITAGDAEPVTVTLDIVAE